MKINHRKAFLCVVALILLSLTLCPVAFGAVPSHTSKFYVNDYADVLSTETEQEIQSTAVSLANETTAQVCVLTIDSLDGEDISEYSVEVFRQWGIGDEEKDNGVLILISLQDREMWITTGYGIEGTLTDTKLGQFRDIYATPYYSNDDFDTGTLELFNAIVNELRIEEYGLDGLDGYDTLNDIGTATEYYAETLIEDGLFRFMFFAFVAIPIVLPGVLLSFLQIKYHILLAYDKKHGTLKAPAYRKKSEKLKRILLTIWFFSRSRNTHHHTGGFRGGGGFGGGGGGGGFRGGGGSTGGGGAGGKF